MFQTLVNKLLKLVEAKKEIERLEKEGQKKSQELQDSKNLLENVKRQEEVFFTL